MRYLIFLFSTTLLVSCSSKPELTKEQYAGLINDFYVSLSASQADQMVFAVNKMKALTESYPQEAAFWANLGVFALRQGNLDAAAQHVQEALNQVDESPDLYFLFGIIQSRRGALDAAINAFEKALTLDASHQKAAYNLILQLERQGYNTHSERIRKALNQLLEQLPKNMAIRFENVRISAKSGDTNQLSEALDLLEQTRSDWPLDVSQNISDLRENARGNLTFQIAFLKNSLNQVPGFSEDLNVLGNADDKAGFLITQFFDLPPASASGEVADSTLNFTPSTELDFSGKAGILDAFIFLPGADAEPEVLTRSEIQFQTARGTATLRRPIVDAFSRQSSLSFDFDYDFQNELLFAGETGLQLFEQNAEGRYIYQQVSGIPKIPARNVWATDFDLEGDLDVLFTDRNHRVHTLRNRGDGSFEKAELFTQQNAIDFRWQDLDGDGAGDAAFLTPQGQLVIYLNKRSGQFEKTTADQILFLRSEDKLDASFTAIEIADFNADGFLEIHLANQNQWISVHFDLKNAVFLAESLSQRWDFSTPPQRLFINDFDNNGRLDVLASAANESRLFLSDSQGLPQVPPLLIEQKIVDVADLNGDQHLDLLALQDGKLSILQNNSQVNYAGRVIRPQASSTTGDRRINAFGIGGEMEIRSGLLYQKQPIASPLVHFGLGNYEEAQLLRIIWPNGSIQAEFAELGYGDRIMNEEILKGSCPWVFTHDGEKINFVTDFLWRSPLGLRINAQVTAGVVQTLDKVKIPGELMKPKEGVYDLRITAELWETHFFDYVELLAVDHPEDTEIFIDERFSIPPPDLAIHVTEKPRPVTSISGSNGSNLTKTGAQIDGDYIHFFERTAFQGIAKSHYVDIELPQDFPTRQKTWLLAYGWVKPTDSSINLAISQGENPFPQGISVSVKQDDGSWKTAYANLGFPAGKNKTVMIELSGLFQGTHYRQLRLTTSTETYWDAIRWAKALNPDLAKVDTLKSTKTELRFRGYSELHKPNSHSPEIPNYNALSGTQARWFDLEGLYTRFGDVHELLEKVDDRYVIINAGDEIRFSFPQKTEVASGMKRDFVLIGDGWVKDGDYNTEFSRTVSPLPTHQNIPYSQLPERLEDHPVYKKYADDWAQFHTRYVRTHELKTTTIFPKNP